MELEFVAERARLLDAKAEVLTAEKGDRPHLCEAPFGPFRPMGPVPFFRWVVSDFWFDQSAAFARAWLPEEQLPAYNEQYERLRRDVVQPKLIVLLDAPADQLLAGVRHRGRECEQRLTHEQLERIRQEVRRQANRPGLGPVLQPAGDDMESILAEVLAAVRGME
jgi:hypothetical protein